jgi:hypothetical protein
MKKALGILIALVVLASGGYLVIHFWEFIFAKTVVGKITKVERISTPSVMTAGRQGIPDEQIFSFGVAIRDTQGEIHTASSEDRQWSVAQAGQCAEAKYFPYAPWELSNAGTYHGARLIRLFDCPPSADGTSK